MTLVSEILKDSASVGGLAVTTLKVGQMDHRSSEIMVLKCEAHVTAIPASDQQIGRVRLCVISKPRSEGIPISVDFDDERYVIHTNCAFGGRIDASNQSWSQAEHDNHPMKIRVPLTNDVYVGIRNDEVFTMVMSWVLRLFWLMI